MNRTLIALAFTALAVSPTTYSQEFVVSYDGFYDRLKIMAKGEYTYADLGFYLVDQNGDKCPIESGTIITKTNEYPLSYTAKSKLLLPFDETLDKDKALIVVQPKQGAECQLKMQIESSEQYGDSVQIGNMTALTSEFENLMGRLSGFFMRTLFSFMMPEVNGVSLVFNQAVTTPINATEGIVCQGLRCTIENPEKLDQSMRLTFSQPIEKVIPHIVK